MIALKQYPYIPRIALDVVRRSIEAVSRLVMQFCNIAASILIPAPLDFYSLY